MPQSVFRIAPGADDIALAEVFYVNDGIVHLQPTSISCAIGKRKVLPSGCPVKTARPSNDLRNYLLGPAEVPEPRYEQDQPACKSSSYSCPVKRVLAAQNAPPKSIDDTNHRVEGVEQTILFRDHIGKVADGRDIEPELDGKWDDV